MKSNKELEVMNKNELRNYLSRIPLNKFPKGNSKFICKKHGNILSYADIVTGCYFCIMDENNDY